MLRIKNRKIDKRAEQRDRVLTSRETDGNTVSLLYHSVLVDRTACTAEQPTYNRKIRTVYRATVWRRNRFFTRSVVIARAVDRILFHHIISIIFLRRRSHTIIITAATTATAAAAEHAIMAGRKSKLTVPSSFIAISAPYLRCSAA